MGRTILLAVDAGTIDLTPDDYVFADALRRRGCEVGAVPWDAPETIGPGASVVVRSTWDYVDRVDEFLRWLDALDARGVAVHNPTDVLRWNVHKGYLLELASAHVPVVPTELVRRGSEAQLNEVLARRGWNDVVIKPAVGGTARLTEHSGRIGSDAAADHLARLIDREDAIVQPVIESVATDTSPASRLRPC